MRTQQLEQKVNGIVARALNNAGTAQSELFMAGNDLIELKCLRSADTQTSLGVVNGPSTRGLKIGGNVAFVNTNSNGDLNAAKYLNEIIAACKAKGITFEGNKLSVQKPEASQRLKEATENFKYTPYLEHKPTYVKGRPFSIIK